ncbi:MAG: hypothetical protein S4CHLAM2_08780 [Chlamydiales bacterium]|nr:hypothetical protein [Chlamydiales bacterium]
MSAAAAVSDVASASHIYHYSPLERTFHHVGGDDQDKMGVITEIFHRILTPLYGSQDKAIGQFK